MQFFQKARVEKNGKNEPIWGLFKNSIWKSLILTKKKEINFFLYNSPKGQFLVKRLVKNAKYRCYSKFSVLNASQYMFNI